MSSVRTEAHSTKMPSESLLAARHRLVSICVRFHWAIALAVYTGISLVLAFPALSDLSTTVIGGSWGDNTFYVWYLWLFRRSVLAFHDPGHTHLVFALLPSVQVFVEALFADVVALPLQALTTPVGAYDLTIVLSFMLSGLTMYCLAGEFVRNRIACFAAGFFYDFSAFHFARAQGHLGLLTMQWLPFCAWRLFALYRRPSNRNAVLAGLGLALVPFSEVYFVPYFEVPFVGLFVLAVLVTDRRWIADQRNLRCCGLAILVAAALAGPYLATFAFVDPDLRASMVPTGLDQYSADLLSFVVPGNTGPVYGHLTLPVYAAMQLGGAEETGFLGYPALLLSILALVLRRTLNRAAGFWLILGVAGVILAVGPELHVGGNPILPVPAYKLLFGWSFLSSFRAPSRLSVVPLMSVAVLAAYGVDAIMDRFRTIRLGNVLVACGLVALLAETLVENSFATLTLTTAAVPIPALYREIGRDHRSGLVLDVPYGPFVSEKYQYFQTADRKPLVFGSLPRTSDRMLNSVLGHPSLAPWYLAAVPAGGPLQGFKDIYPMSMNFPKDLSDEHVSYVVLHRLDLVPADGWAITYLERNLGKPFYRNDSQGLWAWRVPKVRSSSSSAVFEFNLGTGWVPGVELSGGKSLRHVEQNARIVIRAPRAATRALQFDAFADFLPRTLQVVFNGHVVTEPVFHTPGVRQTVTTPVLQIHPGVNTMVLHSVPGCTPVSDVIKGSADPRCFAFGIQQVRWKSS